MEWVERVYAGDRICFGWEPPEPWNAESLGAVIQADGPADWATMAWATHPRPKRAFEWLTPEALARYGPLARELATVWRDAPHFARYGACLEEAVTTLERETATVAVTVCAPEEPFVAQTLACAAVILEVERDALRVVEEREKEGVLLFLERRFNDDAGEWSSVSGWWAGHTTRGDAQRAFLARVGEKIREHLAEAQREILYAEQTRDRAIENIAAWNASRRALLEAAQGLHEKLFDCD